MPLIIIETSGARAITCYLPKRMNSSVTVRKIIGRDLTPSYPNLSGIIIIHTYTREMKLGRVISGKGSSIYLYSKR